jgi:hypothetical protein
MHQVKKSAVVQNLSNEKHVMQCGDLDGLLVILCGHLLMAYGNTV